MGDLVGKETAAMKDFEALKIEGERGRNPDDVDRDEDCANR